jgi:AraC-like DNA-binding protein
MPKEKSDPPRGVLHQNSSADQLELSRYHPGDKLDFFVEHYWIVKWDLREKEPFEQDVLSHPSVHLVFEKNKTRIWGVVSGKFTRKLEGKGKVLGIKFRPGAFYPYYQKSVSGFTDGTLAFNKVFDEDISKLELKILECEENEQMVKHAESFLINHIPDKDPNIKRINKIINLVMHEPEILKVDDLSDQFKLSKRSLQRLFKKYVGISPKWVIQRYRLHEAAEKMSSGEMKNWSQLALKLGYFDQSHFIKDFKQIVGQTPSDYLLSLRK